MASPATLWRPNGHTLPSSSTEAAADAVLTRPAAVAPDTKNMAMNSSPLPRNTVAKKRSSPCPMRSRSTPMNHRNAMPANGSRWRLTDTARRLESSSIHAPASSEPGGSAHSRSTTDVANRIEKASPATAAARGVRIARAVLSTAKGSTRTSTLRRPRPARITRVVVIAAHVARRR